MASFLTPRLFAIAKMVDFGDVVADIGTDHAYLPIYLAKDNKAEKIYACDINEKPLENAKHNVNSFGVANKIELVLSDGLEWLKERDIHINQCIISVDGPTTIINILKSDTKKVDCYILASNTSMSPIREWAKKNKYFIEQETIVLDNEIYYEIVKVNKYAGTKIKNKMDILFGPVLKNNINQDFINMWMSIEDKLNNLKLKIPKKKKNLKKLSNR